MRNYLNNNFFSGKFTKLFPEESLLQPLTRKLTSNWGAFIILFLVTIIGIINFKSGTTLTGWDNLHPEFSLWMNIKRSFFAVWQEYQGLGLLGGMGHASDLVRQLILAVLNLVIPTDYLRYFWTLSTLSIGGIGTYVFIKTFLIPYRKTYKDMYSLIGGLFYVLNLATIQTYYVAFEAFINHFAFLPWMLWAFLTYVKNSNRKNVIIMFVVFLLATPSAYIPTLFVAFLIYLSILLSGLLITAKNRTRTLISSLKAFGVLFAVNSFWLLPFLYFTLTNAQVNLNAKMNQMATHGIFSQNKEFGNIYDVALLKGFWFKNVDPDLSGNFRYMMAPWIEHFNNPLVVASGILIFIIVLLGIANILSKRRPLHLAILLVFLFTFTMLTTNTPPFSWLVSLFRELPLFGQAFRFPFTKFSILAAFSYSLLFVLGIEFLMGIRKRLLNKLRFVTFPMAFILIFAITFPVFKGNLFYEKEQVKIPIEYERVFDFFKKADQNTRIANFPQHTFWGWNFYSWGYGGSGFLWYGIKQPILDRAFDVWSQPLENYYYEASHALYSKDAELFEKVINKYQINYLLVDKNVIAPQSPRSLFFNETELLISKIPSIKKVAEYGNIKIYEAALKDKPKNFLYSTPILSSSNGYSWGNLDTRYNIIGNYIAEEDKSDTFLPFTSLFSNKPFTNSYEIKTNSDSVEISKKLPKIDNAKFRIPSLLLDKILPVEIISQIDSGGNAVIAAHILTPQVYLGGKNVSDTALIFYPLFVVPQASGTYTLNVNGVQKMKFDIQKELKMPGYIFLENETFISLQKDGVEEILSQKIDKGYLMSLDSFKEKTLEVKNIKKGTFIKIAIPYGHDNFYSYKFDGNKFTVDKNCNIFRNGQSESKVDKTSIILTSKNDTTCSSLLAESLPHDIGYLTVINSKNLKGDPLHFWILNNNNSYALIDTELSKKEEKEIFILPPMEEHGLSYSIHADNISIGNDVAQNRIDSVEILPIMYKYLATLSFISDKKSKGGPILFSSSHPNESIYIVSPQKSGITNSTIVLSQSFDPGWKAYDIKSKFEILNIKLWQAFPFIFGSEIKSHVKVNNWANGWELDNSHLSNPNSQIVIVYLPQYLEYLGFVLTILLAAGMFLGKPYRKIDLFFAKKTESLKLKVYRHKN